MQCKHIDGGIIVRSDSFANFGNSRVLKSGMCRMLKANLSGAELHFFFVSLPILNIVNKTLMTLFN